jgi:vacuolar iron transporter family protein
LEESDQQKAKGIVRDFLARFKQGLYIGDFVYGANDGIVTTFAVVAGAAGALLSPGIIIILGFANLFADGFSMGASSFLAIRSEKAVEKKQKLQEGALAPAGGLVTPLQHAVVTFAAFVIAGALPLLPYILFVPREFQFLGSGLLAVFAFFLVGGGRTWITGGKFLIGSMEMLIVGGIASGVAYGVGWTIKTVVGVVI